MADDDDREIITSTAFTTALKTVQELKEALRELHDFAVPSTHYRYKEQSLKAFRAASELLKRLDA